MCVPPVAPERAALDDIPKAGGAIVGMAELGEALQCQALQETPGKAAGKSGEDGEVVVLSLVVVTHLILHTLNGSNI